MRILLTIVLAVAQAGCRKPGALPDSPVLDAREVRAEPAGPGPAEEVVEAIEDPGPGEEADDAPDDGKSSRGPARISLCDGALEAGPVDFKHRKHQKEFECRKCHHEIQPGETPSRCVSCHKEGAGTPDLQTSLHKACIPCHGSLGLGPVKCAECHGWVKKKGAK